MRNFEFLHSILSKTNLLSLNLSSNTVPLVYPYLLKSGVELKKKLIDKQVFVATYWPNVFEHCKNDDLEYQLSENLVNLPLDQRYNVDDMKRIVEIIKVFHAR